MSCLQPLMARGPLPPPRSYNPELQAYNPFNKDWIKQRLLVQLKKMAGQRA